MSRKKINTSTKEKQVKKCSVEWCDRKHKAKGYCRLHYDQFTNFGKILEQKGPRKCAIDGCDGKYYAKGHCVKHYKQIWECGQTLERTKFDPNEFIFEGSICKIQIYDQKNRPTCYAIIDADDYEKVKKYKWSFNHKTKTVAGSAPNYKPRIYLSRLIMDVIDPQLEVDHKNHDKLDNRKENLRPCFHSQNQKNLKILKNNTSGYKGVSWCTRANQWRARIHVNGEEIHLGLFSSKKQAARAYNRASKKYHGEFGLLNVIE
jgi:hypothetical protein